MKLILCFHSSPGKKCDFLNTARRLFTAQGLDLVREKQIMLQSSTCYLIFSLPSILLIKKQIDEL